MLRCTIQLCRATRSYCPDVQRLTKILEFLYCGCRTVINLSGEGHLEIGGWGGGWGALVGVGFDTSCKFAAYQEIESIMQWGGEAKLEPKHEHTVKLASQ